MVDRPLKVADDRQDGCRHCHRNRNPPARKLRHRPKSGKVPEATASLPQPDRCGRDNRDHDQDLSYDSWSDRATDSDHNQQAGDCLADDCCQRPLAMWTYDHGAIKTQSRIDHRDRADRHTNNCKRQLTSSAWTAWLSDWLSNLPNQCRLTANLTGHSSTFEYGIGGGAGI